MIKAVIFDMDGIIINSEPYWRIAEIECFKKVGITLTEEDCLKTIGYRIDEVIEYWYRQFPWDNISKKALEDMIIDEMVLHVQEQGEALPGVKNTLKHLKDRGIPVGVASSSPKRLINAVLDALDIREFFKEVCSAESEEYGKPHPAVFINCAIKMGIRPEESLIFEDSPAGVIAGLASKARVVAVPETHLKSHPVMNASFAVLDNLNDFNESYLN